MTHQGMRNPVVEYAPIVFTGSATSAAFDLQGGSLAGVYIPSGATLTTPTLTFTMSDSLTGTYSPIRDGAAQYETAEGLLTLVPAADTWMPVPLQAFAMARFIKLVLGTSQTSTTAKLAIRPIGV